MNTQLFDGMVIFTEVVKYGSFTKAAEKSGHSTSYISKEINKLEERLGVRLLHRTTRSLNLTPEGDLYYEQCRQIVQDAAQLESAMLGHQNTPKGHLKISCPTSFGLISLAPLISRFTDKYPDITFDVELNDRKVDLVAEGIDIAVRATQSLEDSSLICRKFMTSEGVTVASPDYLNAFGTPNHPNELTNHRVISYRNLPNYNTWRYTEPNGDVIEVNVESFMTSNSSQLILSLCLEGRGIIRTPRFNLRDELSSGKLVELFPEYPRIPIEIFLVYPSRKHMSSKVRSFIDIVIEELGDN
ncbi:LysR family transcriptional regulator [Enterovibrio nigricans]|uniref:Transcriptional regulator, LysR family n=1 Tax=Enterovibrio nigricans DSM 22720 TaxID=1121868 RepID=A0A1T4W0X0_9GAMM|nr:LysR family transcriptional regulator [Enterovibrio nigricans]SKA70698.1 transcriptional regulator, LysR family [Enterovibrio nigricans DSM 22720]